MTQKWIWFTQVCDKLESTKYIFVSSKYQLENWKQAVDTQLSKNHDNQLTQVCDSLSLSLSAYSDLKKARVTEPIVICYLDSASSLSLSAYSKFKQARVTKHHTQNCDLYISFFLTLLGGEYPS